MKIYNLFSQKILLAGVLAMLNSLPFGQGWGEVSAQSAYPGQFAGKFKIQNEIKSKAQAFDLKDVRLLPSRFEQNMKLDENWIQSIETKSLLHSFRNNAGVFSGNEGGYMVTKKLGGWESLDCDLRGHTTGHLLSAMALMYASTGNEVFKLKADSLVKGLAEVQKALGTSGYLSAFPEELINRNIAGQRVWAPWYTLHKLYSGLIDQYLYCDNELALEVVTKMSDWAYGKLSKLDEPTRLRMIKNEFGGINESFYNMYAITGNKNYEMLAKFFYHNEMIDPLHDGKDELAGKHANTFIPKLLGEARNYELHSEANSKIAAENFWTNVIHNHSFCTGSNSAKEKFFDYRKMSNFLTGYTGETCNTYNLLKLSRHLFCWDASPEVADYYERALYNHISGQQDTASGMVSYFLPLMSGSHKVYSTPQNSFWCCVGSGFESHAKYAESIYFHDDKAVYVNLMIPSALNWKEKQIELKQETAFPENGQTTITITKAKNTSFAIYLRYPSWAKSVKLSVNGRKINVKQKSGSYITISRRWKAGDEVKVDFEMGFSVVSTPDNANKAAILYGPIVLAGEMGTEGFTGSQPFSNPALYNDYYTYDYHVPSDLKTALKLDKNNISSSITRKGQSLEFITSEGYSLKPLYAIHRQRYVVYWDLEN